MKKVVALLLVVVVMAMTGCSNTQTAEELSSLQAEFNAVKTELEQQKNKLEESFKTADVDDVVAQFKQGQEQLTQLQADSENTVSALNEELAGLKEKVASLTEQVDSTARQASQSGQNLIVAAIDVATLLKNQDYQTLANQYVDASEGLTFSPMPYIDLANDIHFTQAEVASLASNNTVYTWTTNTASGDPVTLNFADYYQQYVFDQDYTDPHLIGNNQVIGQGNMSVNIMSTYTASPFVALHFTGFDPANEGMDWLSLRLIFKEIGGEWKLLNINHAQWTP